MEDHERGHPGEEDQPQRGESSQRLQGHLGRGVLCPGHGPKGKLTLN